MELLSIFILHDKEVIPVYSLALVPNVFLDFSFFREAANTSREATIASSRLSRSSLMQRKIKKDQGIIPSVSQK